MKEIPIVKHADEEILCFFDKKLKQLRDIYNPHNFWNLNDFEVAHYENEPAYNNLIYQREETWQH